MTRPGLGAGPSENSWRGDRHTDTQTHGHVNSLTESAFKPVLHLRVGPTKVWSVGLGADSVKMIFHG